MALPPFPFLFAGGVTAGGDQRSVVLALPARSLFELTQGATLFLNPRLPYGKEFLPQEVEHMLSGEGHGFVQQRVVEEETEVQLSQPADLPVQMIDSLTQLFPKYRQVRRAFLAQIQEAGEQEPHLLIGLEVDVDDVEEVIRAAGSVASDTLPDERPVDLCLVKEGEPGISHYLTKHTTPFYERRWGSFLRDFKTAARPDMWPGTTAGHLSAVVACNSSRSISISGFDSYEPISPASAA